ncbi:SET domain-containing protein 5 like [Verticillium longisporum]|uniref:SET domain-containing protein 5 like n=1 Tax=Verticillium longisporum TaxID=100787 RepID=A0A8I2ZB53_VERLO|nr:SET domain-containing protein 5 like [Verticillium longisporum]
MGYKWFFCQCQIGLYAIDAVPLLTDFLTILRSATSRREHEVTGGYHTMGSNWQHINPVFALYLAADQLGELDALLETSTEKIRERYSSSPRHRPGSRHGENTRDVGQVDEKPFRLGQNLFKTTATEGLGFATATFFSDLNTTRLGLPSYLAPRDLEGLMYSNNVTTNCYDVTTQYLFRDLNLPSDPFALHRIGSLADFGRWVERPRVTPANATAEQESGDNMGTSFYVFYTDGGTKNVFTAMQVLFFRPADPRVIECGYSVAEFKRPASLHRPGSVVERAPFVVGGQCLNGLFAYPPAAAINHLLRRQGNALARAAQVWHPRNRKALEAVLGEVAQGYYSLLRQRVERADLRLTADQVADERAVWKNVGIMLRTDLNGWMRDICVFILQMMRYVLQFLMVRVYVPTLLRWFSFARPLGYETVEASEQEEMKDAKERTEEDAGSDEPALEKPPAKESSQETVDDQPMGAVPLFTIDVRVCFKEATNAASKTCPYCLYHNRGYAHSRGIVLLTTAPALAHLKRTLAATPPPPPLPEPLFEAVDMPGKGVGLVAQAPIPAGTPLIASPPVLLIHRAFFERPPADAAVLYDQIPALLPAAARRALLRQMGGSVRGIVATNAFQVDVGGDVAGGHHHHFGVFPAISRLNHDCGPNAAAWTGKTDLVHRAFASKDIAAGEEISISYVDALAPRAERRARMTGSWGFECACRRCAAGDESDARVAEIKALEARLGDVGAKVTMGDIERYLGLMKEEGLEGKMAGAYTTAALNYSLFGKQGLAVRHARLAVECGLREEGPHAADVAAMRELAKAPKEHFTWRGRVR